MSHSTKRDASETYLARQTITLGTVLLLLFSAAVAAPVLVRAADQRETAAATESHAVLTGIDVLRERAFEPLAGRRVGLITNHTGMTRDGKSTVDVLRSADNVELVTLFSPEHGIAGLLDQANVPDSRDDKSGIQIVSLYGATRRPTAEAVRNLDTLVFDIQDIGCRFYTYISTMGEAMRAAAEFDLRFVVLDRPNPINGSDVGGPVLDPGRESFVGFHSIPVRHGMTVGELAMMFNEELELDVDLTVVEVANWTRGEFYDSTGLLWINPSPNMRSLTEALLYPGVGLLETTNLSVGRGTDTPFEVFGAPWIDGQQLAGVLNDAGLPGVRFVPLRFTPRASKFSGETCGGVNIIVTDRAAFEPLLAGWEIARQLALLYPETWELSRYQRLLGDEQVLSKIRAGATAAEIRASYQAELSAFLQRRAKYLLY